MIAKRWHTISRIISDYNLSFGAEVGVQSGENIKQVLSRTSGFFFYAVDCWDPTFKYQDWSTKMQSIHEKHFEKVLLQFPGQIKKLKGYSEDVVSQIPDDSLDLVFLDASHDYFSTCENIFLYLQKIRLGGFIGGHDYGHPKFPGVKKAVDEAFKNVSIFPDYVWFAKNDGCCLHIGHWLEVEQQRDPLLA